MIFFELIIHLFLHLKFKYKIYENANRIIKEDKENKIN